MTACRDPLPPIGAGAFSHFMKAGLAGVATIGPDGVVRSRQGALSGWLPEVGHSCFDSPVLSGLDEDFEELRVAAGEPLVLPAVRLAGQIPSRRCHITISWEAAVGEHAVLTTVDQVDRPIDHWFLMQKREQRLLEEKLLAASREIERKNQDLREFTSIAAHDLQAPLRQIASFAAILRGTLANDPAQAIDCIETIEGCAARLTRMISGLLDHARLSSREIHLEPFVLADAVAEACRNLSADVSDCGAVIEVGILPEITAAPALVVNLFQNLIGNSLRYRSPGRVPRITITAAQRAAACEVAVSDNGVGVPPSFAQAIFGSFVRVPRRNGPDGVGLGLALCRKIADLHGWTLALDETQAEGARFVIGMPNVQPARRAAA